MQVIAGLQKNTGEIIYSRHRQDYVETSEGEDFIDGGQKDIVRSSIGLDIITINLEAQLSDLINDYLDGGAKYGRTNVHEATIITNPDLIEDRSTYLWRLENMTWGTYGEHGRSPLKYINLVDAELDHLEAILKTQSHLEVEQRKIIHDIIVARAFIGYMELT